MILNILQIVIILLIIGFGLVVPIGKYLVGIFTDERDTLLERYTYRFLGINSREQMTWQRYSQALVLSNLVMALLGYGLLRLQTFLPLNPDKMSAVSPDLAYNTTISFITNTNWQSYGGETTLSYFSQTAMIQFMMFTSAATGLATGVAVIRGLSQNGVNNLGNFWVDLTRSIYRLFLPLSFVLALVFVWQGMPQTLAPAAQATTLEGATQIIARGPVASLESIKHLGTNGGGFFNTNAAHPFENPTPLTNTLHILSMLLIVPALTYAFGTMIRRRRQGWVFFGVFTALFIGFLLIVFPSEQAGNPLLTKAGVDQTLSTLQSGGNFEGKEVRFGIAQTSLFVTTTTAATTGSVNAMHDSLTPMGGFAALSEMLLNVVFGGKGVGLINLIQYAIITVFLVGLMVGRTPEFLSKKIEAREVKLASVSLLAHPFTILFFTGLALVWPNALASLNNPDAHGFTELLYAYASATANNGSAFAGLNANTPFYNTSLGLAIFLGRYLSPLLPLLAVAGSLAAKPKVPATSGTMSTDNVFFGVLLLASILIVGGLTFFPALALGPIAEHFQLAAGKTF
ncbi:potassium-transporting ATPase subunit KdpA [Aetokthonos hydrillicola Thurmond2011]|jgi:K+-transporting ATPase ATPase A chain|uniref:Potassium-transporting ATPase potassium-binding subunit n=1 Tax=Aetokthonos hydrillicola Thurmond2011 TaxID=2712845 RepID=A0AAP5IDR9_9CYAN|nr:potassium-transporting ATPase subunit KdpA [Aetokthonos hydrillicola]MBO3457987.1 potassium-transporting ATPase subunit KdpA [Aetokthonos hydrillicola CCALA 1050]MBW4587179.1 potassium-transporting ATPase subunit KdpA [Aetokthonos hydrillicola CCALA 1050]MDR9899347.1 potassium-transporting ATPase subunit KdpA [Aetokthonos hydrillicola Thurmond2011]